MTESSSSRRLAPDPLAAEMVRPLRPRLSSSLPTADVPYCAMLLTSVTDATPMAMPSTVSAVRPRLRRRLHTAE